MLRKLAQFAAASVVAVGAALLANPGAAEFRHVGGGGGGMHFGGHGFGGGGMRFGGGGMRFGGHGFAGAHFFGHNGFAAAPFFRSGGFAHYGAGRFGLGAALGGAGARYAGLGRVASATPFGAAGGYRHGWSAWRGYHRGFVGWGGPVFWPYADDDLFDYAFWPYDPYDDVFWNYGYDDLMAGVLLPYDMLGAAGGYGYASAPGAPPPTTGAGPTGGPPPATSAVQLCGSAQSLAGGSATDAIAKAVNPTGDQSAKLDALKSAEADTGKTLAASCAAETPTTAVGRLAAVQTRLQAMVQAVDAVSGPLDGFYASLTDEQKAAFNALGQNKSDQGAPPALSQACGPNNAVPLIATPQIEAAVQPDAQQQTALAALSGAAGKADDAILASCPKQAPLTPPGRLAAVKTRLQAMLDGVDSVRPPMQAFYDSLSDAQKAKFDALTAPPPPQPDAAAQAKP
jgi:hypothetical protein